MPVGTPEMVADVFEDWINIADVDGFDVAYVSNPGSFEDVVELLVPELQKRGLMQTEYAVLGGTLKENLLRQPGQAHLRDDHYGHGFAWENNHDENGKEIVKEKVVVPEKETTQVVGKTETEMVQQQLVTLTKTFSEFMSTQDKVNSAVSAQLERLAPKTNGVH
jgi:hypothetical protein